MSYVIVSNSSRWKTGVRDVVGISRVFTLDTVKWMDILVCHGFFTSGLLCCNV